MKIFITINIFLNTHILPLRCISCPEGYIILLGLINLAFPSTYRNQVILFSFINSQRMWAIIRKRQRERDGKGEGTPQWRVVTPQPLLHCLSCQDWECTYTCLACFSSSQGQDSNCTASHMGSSFLNYSATGPECFRYVSFITFIYFTHSTIAHHYSW